MTTFRGVHMSMGEADEACLQDVLEEVLERIEVGEEQFKQALNLYMEDKEKQPLIKEALEDASIDRNEGQTEPAEKKAMLSR